MFNGKDQSLTGLTIERDNRIDGRVPKIREDLASARTASINVKTGPALLFAAAR
jgi:hypothetical protein